MENHPQIKNYFGNLLSNHNMNLQNAICSKLKEHASLVASGIPSQQALNIISNPLRIDYLVECLDRLTIDELDSLVYLLRTKMYHFKGKKAVYMPVGLTKSKSGYLVSFTDCVLQIDSFELRIEELPDATHQDILKAIKQVV